MGHRNVVVSLSSFFIINAFLRGSHLDWLMNVFFGFFMFVNLSGMARTPMNLPKTGTTVPTKCAESPLGRDEGDSYFEGNQRGK